MSADWSRFACLLLAAVALVLLQSVYCEELQVPQPTTPLVIDSNENGIDLKVHYLEELQEGFGEEKRKFHLNAIEPMFNYFLDICDQMLGPGIRVYQWPMVGVNLSSKVLGLLKSVSISEKDPNLKTKTDDNFPMDTFKMVRYALDKSDGLLAEMKQQKVPKDKTKLKETTRAFLEAIREGVRNSPVVGYVDWKTATVNGKLMQDQCAEVVAGIRYHGYERVIGLAGAMLNIVAGKFGSDKTGEGPVVPIAVES